METLHPNKTGIYITKNKKMETLHPNKTGIYIKEQEGGECFNSCQVEVQ